MLSGFRLFLLGCVFLASFNEGLRIAPTLVTWTNFFALPLALCLAVVICLVMSLIASRRTPDASDRET